MNTKQMARRAAKIHSLAEQGVEVWALAERFNLDEFSVYGILQRPVPGSVPCDGCGAEPGWATAKTVGRLVFCLGCATKYANDLSAAHENWPDIFPDPSPQRKKPRTRGSGKMG